MDQPSSPCFLSKATVLEIHADQIAVNGGDPAILEEGKLDSALAQPMVSFEGHWLHEDLFAMAAAYLFHIAMNHPFADGNKRTALAAALVFLDLNGFEVADEETELADLVLQMIVERRDRSWVAEELRRRARPR